jgi:hypothetical protein
MRWLCAIALVFAACDKKSADPVPVPVTAPTVTAGTGPLRVGVTLHPYYSWVANVIAGVPGA